MDVDEPRYFGFVRLGSGGGGDGMLRCEVRIANLEMRIAVCGG